MRQRAMSQAQRSGVSILLVLICLIVITSVVGTMLRRVVLVNRQTKQRMHASQAHWLAESAIERAVYRLRENPAYRGETWSVDDEAFDARHGRVEINVEQVPSDPSTVTVHVHARFPHEDTFTVQTQRRVQVAIGTAAPVVDQSDDEDNQNAAE